MDDKYTITFEDRGEESERSGWSSFWSYYPELTLKVGKRFYSLYQGQVWEHTPENLTTRNVFYNEEVVSKITTILNVENAEDKVFKTMVLESNDAWYTKIKTNYSESEIFPNEYNQRESKFYAHIRKNSNEEDYTDRVQGIGIIENINGNQIYFTEKVPTLVNVGEHLVQLNDGEQEVLGVISEIENNIITLVSTQNIPILNAFCFSLKNARVQGSEIRGYFCEVTLTNNSQNKVELFAINSNIILSYTKTTQ